MQIKSVSNGKEINLTSDNTVIKSTNFNVDKDGNMSCNSANMKNATIDGGKIILNSKEYTAMKINGTEGYISFDNNALQMHDQNGKGGVFLQYTEQPLIIVENKSLDYIGTTMIVGNHINTGTISADQIKASSGYTMNGKDTGHKYMCHWTGSQLQFFVDVTNVGTLSDKRLKTEIQDIDEYFIKIIDEVEMKQFKVANRNGLISFGILAQDLIEIFGKYNKNPFDYEIVQKTQYKIDDETIYYTINYEQFLILKQKATDIKLQKQQEQIDILLKEIQELKGVNDGKD